MKNLILTVLTVLSFGVTYSQKTIYCRFNGHLTKLEFRENMSEARLVQGDEMSSWNEVSELSVDEDGDCLTAYIDYPDGSVLIFAACTIDNSAALGFVGGDYIEGAYLKVKDNSR